MAKWILEDGTIYQENGGILYDCLNDWLSPEGQQVLCDLLNEGWDKNTFEEIEPELNRRLAANAAPDLLDALEMIIEAFGKGEIKFTKKRQSDKDPYHPANVKMWAAIRKAKGEVSNG